MEVYIPFVEVKDFVTEENTVVTNNQYLKNESFIYFSDIYSTIDLAESYFVWRLSGYIY